jgi:Transglycosylase SLT domain
MRIPLILILAFSPLFSVPRSSAGTLASASPGLQCEAAITAAERDAAIPKNLLQDIGRVESGRPDSATGGWMPWPWTIDVGGRSSYFNSAAEAIAAVRALQARGVYSIDVGCVQINLQQHPTAFANLEQAFDPMANARYGARFLARLRKSTGNWETAVAFYHSATPALAADYLRRVLGNNGGNVLSADKGATHTAPTLQQQLTAAWSATLDPTEKTSSWFTFRTLQAQSGTASVPVEVAAAPPIAARKRRPLRITGRHATSR